ncbi:hypothetical protein [Wenxinia saemankumensis]|uniref:Protease inhibitor Inh n=1 Tax=Wenxinia saemankumensis TaxID=1447782 RepID=A0A1M6E9J8_9RHOB|nr:hypothetical protein [Wenxinia saemankumensis]SHI82166.1 hypothetical protein SAMN05444417_1887 [Wenxinia saemankumensis]
MADMRTPTFPALAALALLAACAAPSVQLPEEESMEWRALRAEIGRTYADVFQDFPFESGPVAVLTTDSRGELRSYTFARCGETVCAGSAHGPRGRILPSLDYTVIDGLYGQRFYLSPGGDGAVLRANGHHSWLAWETVEPIESSATE